ncbi:hypothetical protein J6590_001641 [Homalodisca vitripennis]|nr:hypothetical protein J6590_001641 [Homalodisca vitripennis]
MFTILKRRCSGNPKDSLARRRARTCSELQDQAGQEPTEHVHRSRLINNFRSLATTPPKTDPIWNQTSCSLDSPLM